MSQDPKDPNQDKTASAAGRSGRKEVELFPALHERKTMSMAPVATGGGTRLGTQISIYAPVSFDEAVEIVETLRSRSATTINLDKMKKSDAGRLVDFVCGASAALDGDFHKLTDQVYVFCPSNMKIVSPAKPTPRVSTTFDFLFNESPSDKSPGGNFWPKS